MGIPTIRILRQVPIEMIDRVMGKNGIVLWKKANGIDHSSVQQYSDRKSISTERTFENDTIDIKMLKNILIGMVEKIAYQLRKEQKLTSCITVKIRYSNFDTHTLQRHIPYTAFDHILLDKALELFKKVYQRRMLIRLIGVKFSSLVQGSQQLNMFEDTPEMTNLYQAMDKIRNRYGKKAVRRAAGMFAVKEVQQPMFQEKVED
jgi:DNA polymerase-4